MKVWRSAGDVVGRAEVGETLVLRKFEEAVAMADDERISTRDRVRRL